MHWVERDLKDHLVPTLWKNWRRNKVVPFRFLLIVQLLEVVKVSGCPRKVE